MGREMEDGGTMKTELPTLSSKSTALVSCRVVEARTDDQFNVVSACWHSDLVVVGAGPDSFRPEFRKICKQPGLGWTDFFSASAMGSFDVSGTDTDHDRRIDGYPQSAFSRPGHPVERFADGN